VVGQVLDEPDYPVSYAFITGVNGQGVTYLHRGDFTRHTSASGINNAEQVVGQTGTHAFITGPAGEGERELDTLSGDYSEASGFGH